MAPRPELRRPCLPKGRRPVRGIAFSTVAMSASVRSATFGKKILSHIPGVELVESEYWKRDKGLRCGAGGA